MTLSQMVLLFVGMLMVGAYPVLALAFLALLAPMPRRWR